MINFWWGYLVGGATVLLLIILILNGREDYTAQAVKYNVGTELNLLITNQQAICEILKQHREEIQQLEERK